MVVAGYVAVDQAGAAVEPDNKTCLAVAVPARIAPAKPAKPPVPSAFPPPANVGARKPGEPLAKAPAKAGEPQGTSGDKAKAKEKPAAPRKELPKHITVTDEKGKTHTILRTTALEALRRAMKSGNVSRAKQYASALRSGGSYSPHKYKTL